jgi:hypothetical protein
VLESVEARLVYELIVSNLLQVQCITRMMHCVRTASNSLMSRLLLQCATMLYFAFEQIASEAVTRYWILEVHAVYAVRLMQFAVALYSGSHSCSTNCSNSSGSSIMYTEREHALYLPLLPAANSCMIMGCDGCSTSFTHNASRIFAAATVKLREIHLYIISFN